jgi:hypothetical protein
MSELSAAAARVEKRLARYTEGLRVGSFEVGDNPISDEHAADLRILLAALRDSDGTVTAAANGDLPVPKDCQARACKASPKGQHHGR